MINRSRVVPAAFAMSGFGKFIVKKARAIKGEIANEFHRKAVVHYLEKTFSEEDLLDMGGEYWREMILYSGNRQDSEILARVLKSLEESE